MVAFKGTADLEKIVDQHRYSDDDRLSHLQAVDTRVDVDAVRVEDCQHRHVNVIQVAKLNVSG